MTKQEEKNKVYRKIRRRGKKVENLAKDMVDIHKNPGLDDREKAKMFIKRVKDCDIDFDVKAVSGSIKRESLAVADQERLKGELAQLLQEKKPEDSAVPA